MSDYEAMVRLLEDDALRDLQTAVDEEIVRRRGPDIKELLEEFNRQVREKEEAHRRDLQLRQYESMWEKWRK